MRVDVCPPRLVREDRTVAGLGRNQNRHHPGGWPCFVACFSDLKGVRLRRISFGGVRFAPGKASAMHRSRKPLCGTYDPPRERIDPVFLSPVLPPELKSDSESLSDDGLSGSDFELAPIFRHSGWRRDRQKVMDSLIRRRASLGRIARFCTCGKYAFVYRTVDPPHTYRLAGSACRDRFCTPCANDRSRCLAANVVTRIQGQPARFLTFTLKHSADSLADQIARLTACFAKLRARKQWQDRVDGGAGFIEAKWIPETASWHPHLHVITQGRFFDKYLLKHLWREITGDSYITDIRLIKSKRGIAWYVSKYAAKSVNETFIDLPEQLDEVIGAFTGRRLCHTFGTWRGLVLTATPNDRAWESIGSFHNVATRAVTGDAECLAAMTKICGDRTAEILDAVAAARPPPPRTKEIDRQLTFTWPPVECVIEGDRE